jgi:uncharacterized protein
MPDDGEDYIDGPGFECGCCGLCCRRDPYYAVSLLDIRNISMGLGMSPADFFSQFCAVVDTPGGFRYPVILAPDGCPFLKDNMCRIHIVKPIGCWVFPESALLPVGILKKSVTAIPTCAILTLPDDDRPLKADLTLMAARDIHFEETKRFFTEHDTFDEPSGAKATERLIEKLQDVEDLLVRARELRAKVEARIIASEKITGLSR